ncbi:hypothetical protein Tco_1120047 [Tanacetum coccineum]
MDLLSGGEMTVAAVAVLFSIHRCVCSWINCSDPFTYRVTYQKGFQLPHLGLFAISLDGQTIKTGSGDANLTQPILTGPVWKCIDQVSLHVPVCHNIDIEGALDLELGLSKLAALKVTSPNARPSITQVLRMMRLSSKIIDNLLLNGSISTGQTAQDRAEGKGKNKEGLANLEKAAQDRTEKKGLPI